MRSVSYQSDRLVYTERDADSPWYGRHYHLDLRFVRSDRLRQELKAYVWHHYRYRLKQPATLRQEICWMRYYEQWLYGQGIGSLTRITPADAEGFVSFLHVCTSRKTGRPLCVTTQKHIYQTILGIYRWYACREKAYIRPLLMFPADVYPGVRSGEKAPAVDIRQREQVVFALEQQENECLRAGGRLIFMTGMTLGDLLTLRADALRVHESGCYVHYYHHRRRAECAVPISRCDADRWQHLREYTRELRAEAPDAYRMRLFLYRGRDGRVRPVDPDMFRYWLRLICAEHTDIAPVTCTMLRKYFLCGLMEQQVPSAVVHELTGCGLYTGQRGGM